MLQKTSKIRCNPEVVHTQIDDEMVVMGPCDQQYYGVNAMGTRIWNVLHQQSMTFDSLCAYLTKNYEVDEGLCVADAKTFVEAMCAQQILLLVNDI